MKNVTIKDVAQKAGVSIATVSRVINENPAVAPEIVQKVLSSIKEMGYIPNQIARSLKMSASRSIGFIIADIRTDYFAQISSSIDAVLRQSGYSLIVCSAVNDYRNEYDYIRLLMEKQVDGIIINTTGHNDEFISKISANIPFVFLHRKLNSPTFCGDWIDTDIYSSAYELTKKMIENGHREIGIVSGPLFLSTGQMRYNGYARAMAEINREVKPGHP